MKNERHTDEAYEAEKAERARKKALKGLRAAYAEHRDKTRANERKGKEAMKNYTANEHARIAAEEELVAGEDE